MQASMWTAYLVEQLPREAIKTFYDHGWRCVELGEEHAHDLLKEGDPLKVGAEFRKAAARRIWRGGVCKTCPLRRTWSWLRPWTS